MIDVETLRPTADEMLSGLHAGEAMKNAMLFKASALSALPTITGELLGGLTATPALRHRILLAAERRRTAIDLSQRIPARKRMVARFTPAMGMALALCLMIGIGALYGAGPQSPSGTIAVENGMAAYMAGSPMDAGVPRYQTLFAGEGANPPVIGINGRYYRMLNSPLSVSPSLVGSLIAEVQEYTDEPSLASVVGVISNVAQTGAPIYELSGISHKTACVAEVDGAMRLFQRVSYASMSITGNEMFEDTLSINGQVLALELSGVGIIDNEADANELVYLLSEFALYTGSDMPSGNQALTIYLKNGLSLQLQVQDDLLGACGTWACPEFFEEFASRIAS